MRDDELVEVDEHEVLEGVHVAVEAVVQRSEESLRPAQQSAQHASLYLHYPHENI